VTSNTLWFSPVCDQILLKLETWRKGYDLGEVSATCKFFDPAKGVIDKPTMRAHRIPWTPVQMEYFIRIMTSHCDSKPLIEEVIRLREVLQKGTIIPGGGRWITLNFYLEHIDLMIAAMKAAKGEKKVSVESMRNQDGTLF
jgi:hypothetical protein